MAKKNIYGKWVHGDWSNSHRMFNGNLIPIETFSASCRRIRNILILVPGTTDPVNINEYTTIDDKKAGKVKSNNAHKGYWDQPFLDELQLFVADRAIEKDDYYEVFSWTGDNNFCSRYKAAKKLYSLLKKERFSDTQYEEYPTNIHFICHSHGGNVINEFTNIAAKDHFYEHMKIKSIIYLSTPFFKDQALLNPKILHPKCTIVNAYNKYDLTQRFVANFSMHYMPLLIRIFNEDKVLKKIIDDLKDSPFFMLGITTGAGAVLDYKSKSLLSKANIPARVIKSIASSLSYEQAWKMILNMFKIVDQLLDRIAHNLQTINNKHPKFINNDIMKELNSVFSGMRNSISKVNVNLKKRIDKTFFPGHSLTNLMSDIGEGVVDLLSKFNDFIKFEGYPGIALDSKLMTMLDKIILNQIDKFDDTTYEPPENVRKKFNYKKIDMTNKDEYDKTQESKNYDKFINALEKLEDEYARMQRPYPNKKRIEDCESGRRVNKPSYTGGKRVRLKIIFKLLAQEDYGIINIIDEWLAWLEMLHTDDNHNVKINDEIQSRGLITKSIQTVTGLGKHRYGATVIAIAETRKTIAAYKKEFSSRNDRILQREVEIKKVPDTSGEPGLDLSARNNSTLTGLSVSSLIAKSVLSNFRASSPKTKTITVEKIYSFPFGPARGGIPYLAVESHSVSRRKLHQEIKDVLYKEIAKKSVKTAFKLKKCSSY